MALTRDDLPAFFLLGTVFLIAVTGLFLSLSEKSTTGYQTYSRPTFSQKCLEKCDLSHLPDSTELKHCYQNCLPEIRG